MKHLKHLIARIDNERIRDRLNEILFSESEKKEILIAGIRDDELREEIIREIEHHGLMGPVFRPRLGSTVVLTEPWEVLCRTWSLPGFRDDFWREVQETLHGFGFAPPIMERFPKSSYLIRWPKGTQIQVHDKKPRKVNILIRLLDKEWEQGFWFLKRNFRRMKYEILKHPPIHFSRYVPGRRKSDA